MTKTVVFNALEGFGHVQPHLAIASEMKRRGYRTIFLSTRPIVWSPRVKSLGIEMDHCLDESMEENENDLCKLAHLAMNADPIKSCEGFYKKDGFVYKYMEDLYKHRDEICAKLNSLNPDLVVIDQFLATSCWPMLKCPWVGLFPASPCVVYSSYNENCIAEMGLKPEEMTAEMKELERRLMAPTRELTHNFWADRGYLKWPGNITTAPISKHLNFYLGPKEIGYENVKQLNRLPDCWFRLEHTIEPQESIGQFEIPEKLLSLPGKLIYFSLGTIASVNPELMNKVLGILAKSPHKFIVSMGPKGDQLLMGANMWGDEFLNQKALLPQVDMFITHGGHNSTIEAFYFGVPALVVMPTFADQFDLARRIEQCGYGVWINPYTCTEQELLAAIERQLVNQEVARQMKAISARLKSIDYPKIAADKLEQLMVDGLGVKINGNHIVDGNNNK